MKKPKLTIINQRCLIKSLPDILRKVLGKNTSVIRKLEKLDLEKATPAQVNEVIGFSCWTDLQCDCCRHTLKWGILVETDNSIAMLCSECIQDARNELESPSPLYN